MVCRPDSLERLAASIKRARTSGYDIRPHDHRRFSAAEARELTRINRVLASRCRYDEIQPAVQDGKAEAGLLIHEGQLTYADEGLRKLIDLGEWWSEHTGGLPLPLGGNVIRRDLGPAMISKVSKKLHDSIAYALSHRPEAVEYALQFGRGLDRGRTDTFVGMYVNDLTLSYGDRGRRAVEKLMTNAFDKGLIPQRVPVEFAT